MSYLLDTNVVSELGKSGCHPNVRAWFGSVHRSDKFLSALVIGELARGVELLRRRKDHTQAARLADWLGAVQKDFGARVVPVTVRAAEIWGTLDARSPLPIIDGLIAATAVDNGWTLVTRNTKDMERTGVRVVNPFES